MIKNILVIDNDKSFIKSLRYSLGKNDYNIEASPLGEEGIEKLKDKSFDFIISEMDMPDMDGITICKKIRTFSKIPIIVCSKNNEDISKILCLEYGADDYILKPLNVIELKARMNAVMRRIKKYPEEGKKHIIRAGEFIINTLKREITINGDVINFTGKEFDLFYILVSNSGKIFTREELLKSVWGYDYYGDLRTVDVHIRRIREKVEQNPKEPEYIMTKWGVGYYFTNI